jgi:MFS family permease
MTASASPAGDRSGRSGWSPMREPNFRRLWTAQFVSNIGSWMQTVAAQWVMLSLTTSALLVSSISVAASIPVLLLAVPAGALGDLADRKRLIFATQLLMLLAAAALAVFSALGALTPAILLALLFVIGCGTAASAPTWQTLQPELVGPKERPDAIALGSVNQNLARAIGPALGGLLLAATTASILFAVNAVSFVAVLAAVAMTAIPKRVRTLPAEHALDAARAGARYVANSPTLLALIVRATVFIFPAGATWALLPLVARHKLGLGAIGYGLLLGCVGIGALAAATFGPVLRKHMAPRVLYSAAAIVIALAAVVLADSGSVVGDAIALVASGAAWISGIGLLAAAYQGEMPPWVKARGMSYYLVAFQGSNAVGGLVFGSVAQASSVADALLAIAACLLLGSLASWRLELPRAVSLDAEPAEPWLLPQLELQDAASAGPVMVTALWAVAPERLEDFLALARQLRRVRRRTGASAWRLYRQAEGEHELVETFIVGSWAEHERQHARMYPNDMAVIEALERTLRTDRPRIVHHSLAISTRRKQPGRGFPSHA